MPQGPRSRLGARAQQDLREVPGDFLVLCSVLCVGVGGGELRGAQRPWGPPFCVLYSLFWGVWVLWVLWVLGHLNTRNHPSW